MTASASASPARRRYASLPSAQLHALPLRGLRAPRLPHEPGWHEGMAGRRDLAAFQVGGMRGQRLASLLALPQSACAERPMPVVVAVHDWGANCSTLLPMVGPLLHAGIAVLLFDAASHGDSSAEAFSSLPRFAEGWACRTARPLGPCRSRAVAHGSSWRHQGCREPVGVRTSPRGDGTVAAPAPHSSALDRHGEPRPRAGRARRALRPHRARTPVAAHRLHASLRCGDLLVVEGDHDLRDSLAPHADRLVRCFGTHLGTTVT